MNTNNDTKINYVNLILIGAVFVISIISFYHLAQRIDKMQKKINSLTTKSIDNPCTFSAKKMWTLLENNSEKIFQLVQNGQIKKMQKRIQAKRAETFKHPLKPVINKNRFFMPTSAKSIKNAPLTIIEYSNFQCHYCALAAKNLKDLVEYYNGNVRVLYKHIVTNQTSLNEALMFEAVGSLSPKKAWKLLDYFFDHQNEITVHLNLPKLQLKKMGLPVAKVVHLMTNKAIMNKVADDARESAKFKIYNTPTFLINGVMVEGAIPLEQMIKITDKILKK